MVLIAQIYTSLRDEGEIIVNTCASVQRVSNHPPPKNTHTSCANYDPTLEQHWWWVLSSTITPNPTPLSLHVISCPLPTMIHFRTTLVVGSFPPQSTHSYHSSFRSFSNCASHYSETFSWSDLTPFLVQRNFILALWSVHNTCFTQ